MIDHYNITEQDLNDTEIQDLHREKTDKTIDKLRGLWTADLFAFQMHASPYLQGNKRLQADIVLQLTGAEPSDRSITAICRSIHSAFAQRSLF